MTQPTVAEYVLTRIAQLGIDKIFGVPGDYAFSIDNAVEDVSGLEWLSLGDWQKRSDLSALLKSVLDQIQTDD